MSDLPSRPQSLPVDAEIEKELPKLAEAKISPPTPEAVLKRLGGTPEALDDLVNCPECEGSGKVLSRNDKCWECGGLGKITSYRNDNIILWTQIVTRTRQEITQELKTMQDRVWAMARAEYDNRREQRDNKAPPEMAGS